MRILHLLDHSLPLHSGYTFRTMAILQQQRKLGLQTFHLTSTKQGVTQELLENLDDWTFYRTPQRLSWLAKLPVINQWWVVKTLARRLVQVVAEIKPDIIHAHSPVLNGLAALKIQEWFSIPVVYEVRAFWEDAAVDHGTAKEWGMRYRLTRALETHLFKRANAVTTICEGLKKDIVERGIMENKVTVIANGVDITRFFTIGESDVDLQKKYHLEGHLVLGFAGSFYAYEGLELLIKAMPRILLEVPDARLMLIGGGPQKDYLQKLASGLGLDDKIIFTGRVPHAEVHRYYSLVDMFIYPRLSMRLTELVTPLKPLEAMAQGRLVVASDVGGHKELIHHGETGILFEAGNIKSLTTAVVDLLQHRERWPGQRVAARRYVEHERDWNPIVKRYLPIYQRLMSR